MRVLLVTDWNRGRGGAEGYVACLRDGLRAAGDEVRVLTSSAGSAADGTADYVAYGTERPLAQVALQIVNPFATAEMWRALRRFRPEVVWINMFANHLSPAIMHVLGDVPSVLAITDYKCVCPLGSKLLPDGALCGVRAGWVCHRGGCVGLLHWLRDRPRYALLRSGLRRMHRIVACSRWVAEELARDGIAADPVLLPVPPPGPDLPGRPAPDPVFVFCGRLDREKGVEMLLRAFGRVHSTTPAARLRVVGRGPERPRLEQLAAALGIREAVRFTGWLDPVEVERQLADAWALVAPSLWAEPLGLVALEAMVRGVPVIASATGGFVETVEEGLGGLLVSPDVESLARRMTEVALGRAFPSHRLTDETVRRVAARHDVGRHVEQVRTIFASVRRDR